MMLVTCPCCAAQYDMLAALADKDARQFMDAWSKLPVSTHRPMLDYLRLFKPRKSSLQWRRMLTLLREIAPMIQAARVERNKITYSAPAEVWAATMTELVTNPPVSLSLPLKGHGYLLQILASQVEAAASKAETEKDKKIRHRVLNETTSATATSTTAGQVTLKSRLRAELSHLKGLNKGSPSDSLAKQIEEKKKLLEKMKC